MVTLCKNLALRAAMAAIVCTTAGIAAAQNAPPPTQAAIRGLTDEGKFAEALRGLTRVLELKGPAAVPYNRPEMLLLRAECLLQTRQPTAAKDALEKAFTESLAAGDSVTAGDCLALSSLFARSPGMIYTPKKGTAPVAPKPMGILDRKARPEVYKILFAEMLPETKNKVRAALKVDSMTAVMSVARDTAALRAMEKLAAGPPPDAEESRKMAADLLNHADTLVANSLAQLSYAAGGIAQTANEVQAYTLVQADAVTGVRTATNVGRRRGLSANETQSLKSIQGTCAQIISALNELSVEFATPDMFKEKITAAGDLQGQINLILNDDYSRLR